MLLSYLAGSVAVLLWSILPVLTKAAFAELPVPFFLLLRFGIGVIISIPFLSIIRLGLAKVKLSEALKLSTVLGLVYYLQCLALRDLPVSWYIVIFSLNPIISTMLIGIRFSRRVISGFAFALSGVAFFIFTEKFSILGISPLAFIYLFGGMLTWVLYTVLAKNLQSKLDDFSLTLVTNILSFAAVSVIWFATNMPVSDLTTINPQAWLALLFSSIGLPAAYYLYLYSLRRTPLFCQMSQYIELVFGVLFSVVIYGDAMTLAKSLGVALILSALAVLPSAKES